MSNTPRLTAAPASAMASAMSASPADPRPRSVPAAPPALVQLPTATFQVLVEPDGTTGSYILFDKTTQLPMATVNQAGRVTFISQGNVTTGTAPLSAEVQKLITDVFAIKFTDNPN